MPPTRRVLGALLIAATAPLAGCGGGESEPLTPDLSRSLALSDVGELYRIYSIQKGAPPKSIADFEPLANAQPIGYNALREGAVVARWGATLPDTNEEPGGTPSPQVLAYEKEAPDQGGLVLLLDRTVQPMTAAEFAAAPKAGTDGPAAKAK